MFIADLALSATRAEVRLFLAQRRDLDDDTYEILFDDPDREVRRILAWSTDRPELVSRFARSDEHSLRAIAACRDLCTDEDFERLSRDPDHRVNARGAHTPLLALDVSTAAAPLD